MKAFFRRHRHLPIIVLTLVGAFGGFLYYDLVGCVTGTCPISSQPHLSTLYGAVIGALLGFAFTPKKQTADTP